MGQSRPALARWTDDRRFTRPAQSDAKFHRLVGQCRDLLNNVFVGNSRYTNYLSMRRGLRPESL
jgi:hypothetical protein